MNDHLLHYRRQPQLSPEDEQFVAGVLRAYDCLVDHAAQDEVDVALHIGLIDPTDAETSA